MRRDPVTPETYAEVSGRDRGCVAARFPFGPMFCDGPLELDHVRASGGLGLRSRSTSDNLVVLCRAHHRYKTEHGRTARPILLAYLRGLS